MTFSRPNDKSVSRRLQKILLAKKNQCRASCMIASSSSVLLVSIEKPLRFCVTDVYAEGKGVVARGRVMQGFLEAGERLVVLPIGDTVTVTKLEHLQPPSTDDHDKDALKRLAIAMAGDTVELLLSGIDLVRLSVGTILANPNSRPELSKKVKAKVFILDSVNVPIIRGAQVLFHMQSLDVPAVSKLVAITKRDGSVTKERPRALTRGASAIVELTLSDRIVLEPFAQCRALGRFVLRRAGDTIAVGVIDELL
jgi:elongation factor 1 alpha-like protein